MIPTPPFRFRMTLLGSDLSIQWNLIGVDVDMQHAPINAQSENSHSSFVFSWIGCSDLISPTNSDQKITFV
jgi:hypothetical protein